MEETVAASATARTTAHVILKPVIAYAREVGKELTVHSLVKRAGTVCSAKKNVLKDSMVSTVVNKRQYFVN